MNYTTLKELKNFKPNFKFFIGLDSDGTIFDSMEKKHKTFYVNPLIKIFNLEGIANEVTNVWLFVNLFSLSRGINRFEALMKVFKILNSDDVLKKNKLLIPNLNFIKQWLNKSSQLSDESLTRFKNKLKKKSDIIIAGKILDWSKNVNKLVNETNINFKIFKGVSQSLKLISKKADIMVLSNTPNSTLLNNWSKNKINQFVSFICGQETGTKNDMLHNAIFGKYESKNTLIIGDSNNDYTSAKKNKSNFFPIIPNKEMESWNNFLIYGAENFFSGNFTKSYEQNLVSEFKSSLKTQPPWK